MVVNRFNRIDQRMPGQMAIKTMQVLGITGPFLNPDDWNWKLKIAEQFHESGVVTLKIFHLGKDG